MSERNDRSGGEAAAKADARQGAASSATKATQQRGTFLDNEKKIILAFRFVVALVALAFFIRQPPGVTVPWQFYFVMGVFLLSNVVFFFEGAKVFDTHRAQTYIFAFDVGIVTILMIFLGLTNKEFYLVFFMTIFISALSKRASHAFAISAVMAGLYVVFAVHGKTDVDLTSASFLVRVILFFVVSSFVGHLSEVAEKSRRDVSRLTEWKENAETLAMEQDKMAAVGLLAAGVAHEFNNLLAGIQGYADLAKMGALADGELATFVAEQSKRAAGIVRDLLSFSRKRGGPPEPVAVGRAVDEVFRLVHKELVARDIEVERRMVDALYVEAEPGAIERTALNLVMNAIEAMGRGGKLTVDLSENDGSTVLRVSDNGRGMDAESLSKAFEPFFSTRPGDGAIRSEGPGLRAGDGAIRQGGVVRATGLGLAVSKRLVERCGGTIAIESEPGKGTSVTVRLPSAAKAEGHADSEGLGGPSSNAVGHQGASEAVPTGEVER